MRRNRSIRVFGVMLLLFILATATYAFTATNTFNGENRAGQGAELISGYEVSNISYTLGDPDPTMMTAVSFDLNVGATDVQARVNTTAGSDGDWADCDDADGNSNWSCTFDAPESVNAAVQLEVVAVN